MYTYLKKKSARHKPKWQKKTLEKNFERYFVNLEYFNFEYKITYFNSKLFLFLSNWSTVFWLEVLEHVCVLRCLNFKLQAWIHPFPRCWERPNLAIFNKFAEYFCLTLWEEQYLFQWEYERISSKTHCMSLEVSQS